MIVKRGDIYYADLSPVVGSEQGGIRPVLVIQNDIGNKYNKDSVILLEQIRTIDKRRLREKIGRIDDGLMASVNNALSISFGLGGF